MMKSLKQTLKEINAGYPIISTVYGDYYITETKKPVYGIRGVFTNTAFYNELNVKFGVNFRNGNKNFYNSDKSICIESFIEFINKIKC